MTQLGPAWVEYSFGCDCSVKTRVQLMWMRITERARYSTNAGEIHYDRKGGPMKQSYRFDGEKLMLTDAPGEVYAHTRQGRRVSCPATSAPSYQAGFFPPL
jgi:hypothetical protein